MEHWEFLIQKEGDRNWHPVKQPVWEIEEGKYRLLVHCERANIDVEIRLLHEPCNCEEFHQVRTYSRRINSEGLLMVLPFTYLKPGLWEVRCYGDILSELLGQVWQERVQLQVLAKQKDRSINNPSPLPPLSHPSPSSSSNPKTKQYLQQLEQLLKEDIEPKLRVLENPVTAGTSLDETKTNPAKITAPTLRLILDQDMFIRVQGEAIPLAGKIEIIERDFVQPDWPDLIWEGKLRYEIRNLQTENILLNIEYPVTLKNLPFVFCHCLEIPSDIEEAFLLGEVTVETSTGNILERQPFTITTDLNTVLQESYPSLNKKFNFSNTEEKFSVDLNLEELVELTKIVPTFSIDLPEPSKMSSKLRHQYQSGSGKILPPKIFPSPGDKKSLRLPDFSEKKLPEHELIVEKSENNFASPNINQKKIESELEEDKLEHSENIYFLQDEVKEPQKIANNPHRKLDLAFESLNLEERFLLRLSSLAEIE